NTLPFRIEMPVVPGDVFLDHRAGGRMRRDVLDLALAEHPDLAPVAQRLAIIGAGAHAARRSRHAPGRHRSRNCTATTSGYGTSSSRMLMRRAKSLIAATERSLIAAS